MNKFFVSLLLTMGVSGIAQAAGTTFVGDAAAGQAKTAVCGACHGPDGNSMAPNFPKLAGQGDRYLLKQLHEIKDGKRQVLEMTGQLTNLNDQDLADIAAYYASQKALSAPLTRPWLLAEKNCSVAATCKKACPPAPAAMHRTARATHLPASPMWAANTPVTSRNSSLTSAKVIVPTTVIR